MLILEESNFIDSNSHSLDLEDEQVYFAQWEEKKKKKN